MRTLTAIGLALLGATSTAHAFHGQADFAAPALEGGGAGLYYSGSARARGFDCSLCHVDAPGEIELALEVDPPLSGAYVPGVDYRVTVRLEGEHRGLGAALNPNTFVFEAVGAEGAPAGLFSGLSTDVERPPGEELVVARGEFDGVTDWSFTWTAPAAGSGAVTWHVAGVDGDGAGDRLGRTGDPFGDDVFVGELPLGEAGASIPAPTATGCAVGQSGAGGVWLLALLLGLLARRRAPVGRRALLGGLALLVLVGCHDPRLERGPCERGICGEPGVRPGADAGAPGDGAPPPPTDGGRRDGGVIELDGCTVDWRCTPWDTTACDGNAVRSCTDMGACGTDVGRPPEARALPALDESFYRCRVQPVWDRSCSQLACHGTDDRPLRIYARVKWRVNPTWRGTHNDGGDSGLTAQEWQCNFDAARAFTAASPDASELLTQPLRPSVGGLPHAGFTLFEAASDPDYQTIREWLQGASLPSCDTGFN